MLPISDRNRGESANPVDFQLLQTRLLDEIRARVHNGEMTERSLGRLTGISQPHIHNVLKGVRVLSLEMADHLLRRLRIDLADLVGANGCRMVELLDGYIGNGHPYPRPCGRQYPFPAEEVKCLRDPVAVRLAPAAQCPPLLPGGAVLLLDRGPDADPDAAGEVYFAVDLGSEGRVGMMRAGEGLRLWNCHSGAWETADLAGRHPVDLIRGRIRLLVRHL